MTRSNKITEAEVLKLSKIERAKLPAAVIESLSNEFIVNSMPMRCQEKLSEKRQAELLLLFQKLALEEEAKHKSLKAREAKKRAELAGDGDTDIYRFVLEIAQYTGMTVNEVWDSSPDEIEQYRKAILKRRKSKGWIEKKTNGWHELLGVSEKSITTWSNNGDFARPGKKRGRHEINIIDPLFIATMKRLNPAVIPELERMASERFNT